jgi:hypothetical protein
VKGYEIGGRAKPERELRRVELKLWPRVLSACLRLSRGVEMISAAQEYRNKAAACLQLSRTMDDDNRRRLEDIARRWLELAKEDELDEREYLEAAE